MGKYFVHFCILKVLVEVGDRILDRNLHWKLRDIYYSLGTIEKSECKIEWKINVVYIIKMSEMFERITTIDPNIHSPL